MIHFKVFDGFTSKTEEQYLQATFTSNIYKQ